MINKIDKMNNEEQEYELFGEEWQKEVSKLTKARIIEIAVSIGKAKNKLETELKTIKSQLK